MRILALLGPLALVAALLPAMALASATIVVVNADAPGEGFNDNTPWTPTGGNPATTLGQARLNAFQYAADIWGSLLESNVTIRVQAEMNPLTCTPTAAILGSAGAATIHWDFAGAPRPNTYYPQALANALFGADVAPGNDDITSRFNSSINGDPQCLNGASWYYGFDADPPGNDYDFVTVVLHELGHGLGFQTFMNVSTGAKLQVGGISRDDMFLAYLERAGASPADFSSMSDAQRLAANVADPDVRWTGGHLTYMLPGAGLSDGLNGNRIRAHAPNPVVPGSSISHFSIDVTPNEIMEPVFTAPSHDPGLAVFLMKDIGWELDAGVPVAFEQVRGAVIDASVEVTWRFWADEAVTGFHVYRVRAGEQVEERVNRSGLLGEQARRFVDDRVDPGTSYRYAVAAVLADGSETRSAPVTVTVNKFATELVQNHPNPFNPATNIRYRLGADAPVTLRIYDPSGRLVRTLVDERQESGSYTVTWNGRNQRGQAAPAGVYLARLETDQTVSTRRMVLLK